MPSFAAVMTMPRPRAEADSGTAFTLAEAERSDGHVTKEEPVENPCAPWHSRRAARAACTAERRTSILVLAMIVQR